MSWLFSQALVEAFLEENSSDGEQSALLSGSPTPQAFLSPDKMIEFSRISRFGMTFRPLTESLGTDVLMWCQAVSRAKTSALQEKAPESTVRDQECGHTWRASLARFDPNLSMWKTVQPSLLGDLEESSVTWPRSGMTAGGQCWELPMSGRRIKGTDSGLWPTPSGTSNHGKNHVVGRMDEWGGSSNPFRGTEIARVRCASFEEWMMGWPTGWSALTPLEMGRFHCAPQQPGESLQAT